MKGGSRIRLSVQCIYLVVFSHLHSLSHSLTLSLSHSRTLSLSHSLTLSLSHSLTLSLSRSLALSLSRSLALSLSRSLTLSLSLSHSLNLTPCNCALHCMQYFVTACNCLYENINLSLLVSTAVS